MTNFHDTMQIDAVLFDLDGTLMDTSPGILSSIRDTIRRLSLPMPDDEQLLRFIGPPIRDIFQSVFRLSDETADAARDIFRTVYPREHLFEASVYDGIPELLRDLRAYRVPVAIATSKPEWYAMPLLEKFDMVRRFDVISCAQPGHETKTEVLRFCLGSLNLPATKRVMMIGDTVYDRQGAAGMGLSFIPVAWGFGFGPEEPGLCPDVSELRRRLFSGTCV